MSLHLGNIPAGTVLYIPFTTYGKTNGESITLTGLAVTDIEIFKNGSTTQRSSDAGYALLDTDGIDFDGITGLHGFSIDLGDNTDAGFYAAGSFYWVVVSAVTVDGQVVNFVAATFRIVAGDWPTAVENADALLKRDWTSVTGEAARSVLNALRAIRNKWTVSAGTWSVKKEDDTTEAWNASVSGDAAAEPIVGSDPS
jgi:hypothetical protein